MSDIEYSVITNDVIKSFDCIVWYNLTFELSKISKHMYGWKWKGMPYFHSQNEMLVGFFKFSRILLITFLL